MLNSPSTEELVEIYRRMVVVRELEEELGRRHRAGETRGPVHRCDGQEAVGVAATAVLRRDDLATSTHRGHAHYVGKGVPLVPLVAEIFGRAAGSCGGLAGHMLIADREAGLLGGCGIVGGAIPVAVGQALALQAARSDRVVMAFFGEGAAQIGAVHEAMNVAALWRLPVVFVCEHNGYGLTVAAREQSSVEDIAVRARGYGMPGVTVDGNDAEAVYRAAGEAVGRARRGEGPSLVEAKTFRLTGFSTSDVGGYQSDAEMALWRARDPLPRLRARLIESQGAASLDALERAARAAVAEAFAAALQGPAPALEPYLAAGEYHG